MTKKVRVNFSILQDIYNMVQDIAKEEGSSSADVFRKAVKKYVYSYKKENINKFYSDNRMAINCKEEDEK